MERHRLTERGSLYFVTFSVVEWLPVFVSEDACRIVTESLNFCHEHKGLRTNAYVVMPTHLHGMWFHESLDGERLREALVDFRKYTGRSLSDFCEKHMPRCFADAMQIAAGSDRSRQFWQESWSPEVLESDRFWRQKFEYLHDNPRRKGLVTRAEYWRYSSASYWFSGGKEPNPVKLSMVPW